MAATEVKEALRAAATTISQYVRDMATLTVVTQTMEVGSGQAVDAARSEIKLDGDNSTTIPVTKSATGKLEVDTVLYDLHMQNVKAATDYRAQLVGSMLRILRTPRDGGQ
jgi:hypothetical protein